MTAGAGRLVELLDGLDVTAEVDHALSARSERGIGRAVGAQARDAEGDRGRAETQVY